VQVVQCVWGIRVFVKEARDQGQNDMQARVCKGKKLDSWNMSARKRIG